MSVAEGTVVAVFGRRYEVELASGERLDCVARARRHEADCGDRVGLRRTATGQGVIEEVLPRSSYLERADRVKRKAIAANADLLLVLVAVEPWFSDEFVARVLLLAGAARMDGLIVLNKVDLPAADAARDRLKPFAAAGAEVIEIAARPRAADGTRLDHGLHLEALRERLRGRSTVLVGQSGMGKSSLVNALSPGANAATGDISHSLGSGRHTTTFSCLYRLDPDTTLIDCPGMQEVGLANLDFPTLVAGFAEFEPLLGSCRFRDCRHDREPGCAIHKAADEGRIDPRRLELFARFREELGR